MAEAKKKTKKEIVKEAYPEGKKIKLNERVEVEMLIERNGFTIGQKVKMHPSTATHFKAQNWAK